MDPSVLSPGSSTVASSGMVKLTGSPAADTPNASEPRTFVPTGVAVSFSPVGSGHTSDYSFKLIVEDKVSCAECAMPDR